MFTSPPFFFGVDIYHSLKRVFFFQYILYKRSTFFQNTLLQNQKISVLMRHYYKREGNLKQNVGCGGKRSRCCRLGRAVVQTWMAYVASSRDFTYSPAVTTSYLLGDSGVTQVGIGWEREKKKGKEKTFVNNNKWNTNKSTQLPKVHRNRCQRRVGLNNVLNQID